jgi:tripartite-type tricarboxylate transporter receptor subunit TctC
MKSALLIAAATLITSLSFAARAEGYPDKPVRIVVPYAPGGTTDVIARVVGAKLGAILKQPFLIENRPGAGGALGSAYAAKSPADGYTLVMLVESSHAVNPQVYAKTTYDPIKDFAPISNLADVPNVLVVNPSMGVANVPGLIKELKANPQKYSFGSSGNGGLSHMNGELFMTTTGTTMLHVPYKGLGPALSDLMAGQIQVVFDNIPSSVGLIKAGKILPLAVAAKKRLSILPNVPTYAEIGLAPMNNPSWFGLGAPAGAPPEVLDKLNSAVREALASPAVASAIENQGGVPNYTTRNEFGDLVNTANAHWKKVVTDIKFEKL